MTETFQTVLKLYDESKTEIKIASWNLKNATINNHQKIKEIISITKDIDPDIIALHEICSPEDALETIQKGLGEEWCQEVQEVYGKTPFKYSGLLWKESV